MKTTKLHNPFNIIIFSIAYLRLLSSASKGLSPLNSNFGLRSSQNELRTPNLIHTEKAGRTKSIVIKSHSLLFRTTMRVWSQWELNLDWLIVSGSFWFACERSVKTKHPNALISDTNVRMKTENNEFASEIRIKWRWALKV